MQFSSRVRTYLLHKPNPHILFVNECDLDYYIEFVWIIKETEEEIFRATKDQVLEHGIFKLKGDFVFGVTVNNNCYVLKVEN
jgi:hypothetical protein